MSGEKTETNMASLAATNIKSSTSAMGVEISAGILASTSFQPPPTTSALPVTPSLNPLETSNSSSSTSSFPSRQLSPYPVEVSNSDPQLTPFPDLNLQTATLLARLKDPSSLSTEELQSATTEAMAALSAWKSEWLNIEDTKRQERGLKPAAHIGITPRRPNTVREEDNRFWEGWNEPKRLGVGVSDMELRAVERVVGFPAAEAGPSRAPVKAEAEEEKTTITPSSQTPPTQDQADPSTSGRGQRARKPRKFFGETSTASRDQKRVPREGKKNKVEQRTPAKAQSLPKQEASRAKPNASLAGKGKREDPKEEGEIKSAAESSRQKKIRVSSATLARSQESSIKAKFILNPPKPAPTSCAKSVTFNTEPPPLTTRSMSRAATHVVTKNEISQAASTSASIVKSKSKLCGKRKCLHNNDDGEQVLPAATEMTVSDLNQAPLKAPAPTSATTSLENAVKHAKRSAKMREVWVRRRAEGTGGLYGGQPTASTVEKWKNNMVDMGEFKAEE